MSSGANLLLFVALDSLCQGLCSDAIIGLAGMIGHRFSFLHSTALVGVGGFTNLVIATIPVLGQISCFLLHWIHCAKGYAVMQSLV